MEQIIEYFRIVKPYQDISEYFDNGWEKEEVK